MIRIVRDSEREEQKHPLDVIDDGREISAYVAELQARVRSALPDGDLSRIEAFSFGGADGGGGIVARVQGEHFNDVVRIINDPRVSVFRLTRDEYVHAIEATIRSRKPEAKVQILDVGENRKTCIAVPEDMMEEIRHRLPAVLVTAAGTDTTAKRYIDSEQAAVA